MRYNRRMTSPVGDFLDGRFVVPASPDGELAFPAPGRLDVVPYRAPWSLAHVERAVAHARAAQEGWRKTPQAQRSALLRAYGAALMRRKAELGSAISSSIGKPTWESATEVDAMIAKVEISLGAGLELLKYPVAPDANTALRTRPIGVCAVLGPFNFPGHLANGHFVPALATGNTIIFKPSERAPEVGALIAACIEEAGFPPGVFGLLQGGAEVAAALVAHDGVDGVMFTGSTAVGSRILAASAKSPGRMLALELGGRNCALVLGDADLLHAARELAFSAFVTAGQRCTANSRILVHRSVAEALTEKLAYAARETRVGPWDAPDVFLGPVISGQAVERLESLVEDGAAAFEAVVPLRRAEVGARGHYLGPAVYRLRAGAQAQQVALGHEELFGPLLTLETFDDLDEALARANRSRYGLAAAVFTASQERFEHCADALDVGLCNWNRASVGSSSKLPFGGRKQSGNHRPAGLFSAYSCVDAVAQLHVPTPPAQATLSPGLKVR